MKVTEKILLGGHISTAGGISNSPARAAEFGFRTLQVFSKNQMQWKAKPLPDKEIEGFRTESQKSGLRKMMVHASYLLNLGSADPDMTTKVKDALAIELDRANRLEISYLVLHPGSSVGSNEESAIKRISAMLNTVLHASRKTMILLETAAGQGSNVGYTFEQLARMIDGVDYKNKIGVCFDTCHVFASGYDIKSPEGYAETMNRFSSQVGWKYLLGFHLNDSKGALGSRIDRHEQIGKGKLGLEGISNFVNDRRLTEIPMVLETPKGEEGYADDIANIEKGIR